MKFKNNWTNKPKGTGEVNEQPSLTIPDEAYTIQEIFERSASGLIDTTQTRQGYYPDDSEFDDIDLEKISRLDFTEIEEHKLDLLENEIALFKKSKEDVKESAKEKSDSNKSSDTEEKSNEQ